MEGSTTRQGGRIKSSVRNQRHGAHHTQKEANDDETHIAAPSFLKVVEEEHLTHSSSLSIPEKFMEEQGYRIDDAVSLIGPDGNEYLAFLGDDRAHASFRAGFAHFLAHHDVQARETLLFSLVGNSTFRIKVYNEYGCERKHFTPRWPNPPPWLNVKQEIFKSSDPSSSKKKLCQVWNFFDEPHRQAQRHKETSRPKPHNGADGSDNLRKKRCKTDEEEVEEQEEEEDEYGDGINEVYFDGPISPMPGIGIVRRPGLQSYGKRSEQETQRQPTAPVFEMLHKKPTQYSPKNSSASKPVGPDHLVRQNSCTSEKKILDKGKRKSSLEIGHKRKKVRHHLASEFEPLMTFPHDSEATAPKEAFVMQLAAVEACKTRQPSTRLYINKISATHSSAIFPTEFAKKWIPSGTQQVRLTKNARRWTVSWDETQQRRPSLGNGWSRFAKENELRDGDVCVLELVHPVRVEFRVHLFRIADYVFEDPAPDQRFVDPPGSRMSLFNGIGVANGCKSAAESSRAGSLRGRKSIAVDAEIREAVNAFQLRNPHIPIVMRVGHIIRQYNVYLPRRLPMPRESADVTLLDTAGVEYPAVWLVTSGGRRLAGGWKKFALEKEIEVGDVCVFEITDLTILTITVHILRKRPDHIKAIRPHEVQPQVQAEDEPRKQTLNHAAFRKPPTHMSPLYRALLPAFRSKNIKKMHSDNTRKDSTKAKSVPNPCPKITPAQKHKPVAFRSTKEDAGVGSSAFPNMIHMENDTIVTSWLPGGGHPRLLVKVRPISTRPTLKLQLLEDEVVPEPWD